MACYEHLPIYKSAMDLALEMEETVRNMRRYGKYGIGTELRKRSLAILPYGFITNRIRKILCCMSGVLIRETEEITIKIKARISMYSLKLQRAVQLELFKIEERRIE
jgi:hypothetical protein